jgi:hypothetical protein
MDIDFVAAEAKIEYHSKNKQMIVDRKANYTLNDY